MAAPNLFYVFLRLKTFSVNGMQSNRGWGSNVNCHWNDTSDSFLPHQAIPYENFWVEYLPWYNPLLFKLVTLLAKSNQNVPFQRGWLLSSEFCIWDYHLGLPCNLKYHFKGNLHYLVPQLGLNPIDRTSFQSNRKLNHSSLPWQFTFCD